MRTLLSEWEVPGRSGRQKCSLPDFVSLERESPGNGLGLKVASGAQKGGPASPVSGKQNYLGHVPGYAYNPTWEGGGRELVLALTPTRSCPGAEWPVRCFPTCTSMFSVRGGACSAAHELSCREASGSGGANTRSLS